MKPPVPTLRPVCTLTIELGPIREMGEGRGGRRRIIPITGGTVTGAITGHLLNLGADWQLVYSDGTAFLDTRYAFETDDGALIEVVNLGFRHGPPEVLARLAKGEAVDPTDYTMRTSARLETGDARYGWVNRTVFVSSGSRSADGVIIDLYAVD
ncbi:DUF3237 domain-containing protein [Maritimibacter sp. UBA3975]|uniref:DUF3237 domain-containing protein n=1 Tax=Maritimibacter sp. UBA3975 TaxID=1946833 RepID=UPI000C0BAEC1|nr:DUF3237 domain-containing protein [Maritimibacter sp. UBA3975]MAM61359.1 hypothetical protein [Maritimibacter sp.]|tara:strand:- start:12442 stop:12903 length:462 start_codon:yes stop_codon:yes gene_type:complete